MIFTHDSTITEEEEEDSAFFGLVKSKALRFFEFSPASILLNFNLDRSLFRASLTWLNPITIF